MDQQILIERIRALEADVRELRGLDTLTTGNAIVDASGGFPNVSSAATRVVRRTDESSIVYVYDDTLGRWLSLTNFTAHVGYADNLTAAYSTTTVLNARLGNVFDQYPIHIDRIQAFIFINGLNNTTNYYRYEFVASDGTVLWSFNTGLDTTGQNYNKIAIASNVTQSPNTINHIRLDMTAIGSPGIQYPRVPIVSYRYKRT